MQKQVASKSKKSAATNGATHNGGMQSSQLMKLFEAELKDIYWAEKALVSAIPKMIKNATSKELVTALQAHLLQTKEQVSRAEQIFNSIDIKPVAKKCLAMEGLIKEAASIMEDCELGAMCDAGIISAAQKIEHYEIASYGTLSQFAEVLELSDAVTLLRSTLHEEKAADDKLTEVATTAINIKAAELEEA